MNDTLLEKVTCSFAVIGEIAGSQLTETDSSCTTSTPFDSSKHQRTLFSVKPQSSKLVLESHSSSSGKKTGTVAKNKGEGVASSSNSEEHVATKRGVYSSTKTMSFYSSSQKMSDSSSPSISSGVIERSRKRSQSSLSEKKSMSRGISTSKIPLLPISKIIHEDDSLELYFNHLFDCDPMIATEFVLSLARPKDKTKLSWGIRVLNEASGKFCQHIAVVLLNHLSEPELLMLVAQLYQLETGDSWCRGNKLLPLLIQHYLEHEDRKEYKKMVWEAVFALADSLRSIDLTQCESDTFTVELFKAEQTDIEAVQQHFLSALNTILSPKQFPAFIQGIAQLGYADLKRREELDSSEHVLLCKLIAFILIRVINPIISQEAQLLKESVLKQWYLGTIPAAIQSLTSPLVNFVESSSTAVRDLIFGAITKDIQQRNKIYMMMAAELHVGSIVALPLDSESSLARDHENCKYVLNEMLKQEQFSGLHFKANGTVTPSRNTSKPPVLSFFESGSHESLAFRDSTTPRKGGGKQLLETVIDEHVDNGDCTSSSGTTGSPRANSSI
ncbi:hypothetical protein [uncultured Legionella sp.]|uniref:hypothetical protein n=1 Tax=uncultured Legionella sp. TaxID=210934 RepID=UPI002611C77F|nr:hypothetical protein [uncultured Legionella sp.]